MAAFVSTEKLTPLKDVPPVVETVHCPAAGLVTVQLTSESVLMTLGHLVAPAESLADIVTFPVPPDSLTDKVFKPEGRVNTKTRLAVGVPDRVAEEGRVMLVVGVDESPPPHHPPPPQAASAVTARTTPDTRKREIPSFTSMYPSSLSLRSQVQ